MSYYIFHQVALTTGKEVNYIYKVLPFLNIKCSNVACHFIKKKKKVTNRNALLNYSLKIIVELSHITQTSYLRLALKRPSGGSVGSVLALHLKLRIQFK